MIKILNELIDKNLNFMCGSKSGVINYNDFIDLKGHKLVNPMSWSTREKGQWLASEMKDKGLIKLSGSVCSVSELGYDIFQKGGWLKHLESQKTLFRKQLDLQEKEEAKEQIRTQKLIDDAKVSRLNAKYRYVPYIVSFLSLTVACLAYFKPTNTPSNKQLSKDEIIHIVDSILASNQTKTDTLLPSTNSEPKK